MSNTIMTVDITDINQKHKELHDSFMQIFNGRSQYQISNFVVGPHCTLERQYDQCVTELQCKYYNIKREDIKRRKLLKQLESVSDEFEKEEKLLDLEQLEIGIISNIREFNHLYNIYSSMPKFTAEQLQEAESKYWLERLSIQAMIDVEATGTIGTGNHDALRQIDLIGGHASRLMHYIKDHPGVNQVVRDIAKEIENRKE